MVEFTVSAGYAKDVLEYAVRRGADRNQLPREAQIDGRVFDDPENRVLMDKHRALIIAAKTKCYAPTFALEFCAVTLF